MIKFSGIFALWLILIAIGFSAGEVFGSDKSRNTAQLIQADGQTIELVFNTTHYQSTKVLLNNGFSNLINLENGSPILEAGAPDLHKLTASVIIPDTEKMNLEIVSSDYYEVENILVAPSKGNLYRNQNPADVPFFFGPAYTKNTFYPGNLAELRKPYILRDFRGQTIVAYPLQYNPVTKVLRVYTKIQVKLTNTGEKGENIITDESSKNNNAEFRQIYQHQFLNYSASKYNAVDETGNMLIVCPPKYRDAVTPLANWKNKRGIATEIVEFNSTTTGTSALALQTYIKKYYNEKGLAFLLLIGDGEDIPSLFFSGDSDVAYSYMAGNDSYPEFFVGRMSASTIEHVQTQVEKTIAYERDLDESATWLSNGLGIASAEGGSGSGDDGESDKQHMEKIKTDLLSFTYNDVTSVYDPGASSSMVSSAINNGVSVINYVGHGSDFSWGTSGFNVSAINKLTNQNKWPYILDVACVNGNFHNQTCFAEAFMRARNNSLPTGAVAIIASTINQAWNPPMDAQDEMVDILIESYENNIKRTFGGIVYNGCLHMNDEYGAGGEEMTDTWTTFGDPSLLVRTAAPVAMEISHTEEILIGHNSLQVVCNVEDALVSLSNDHVLITSALVKNGVALLEFEPFTTIADLDIVVTAFNKITYQGTIKVIPAAGPFINIVQASINDLFGNNNQLLENNEDSFIEFQIQNVGVDAAGKIAGKLTCTDEYIQITNNSHNYGTIQAGIITGNSSFSVHVADSTPNMHPVTFKVTLTDSLDNSWSYELHATIQSPNLVMGKALIIENGMFGNGNNLLEPGESAIIELEVSNIGKNHSTPSQIKWLVESPYATIEKDLTAVEAIEPGNSVIIQQKITTNATTPLGTNALVIYDWENAYSLLNNLEIAIGQAPSITIGNSSTVKYNYPFYNYYKSNKTQLLYSSSEFTSGKHIIHELAFNFASITLNAPDRVLNNFVLKIGVTDSSEINGGYLDLIADTVLFIEQYELPDAKGWNSIKISPFAYNTLDGNLVVEIYWGINDQYCSSNDRTSVFTTETAVPTVAYGYADTEYPAIYDGMAKLRPNIIFGLIDQTLKQDSLTIEVVDSFKIPVREAIVSLGSQYMETDSLGIVRYYLAHGNYNAIVSKSLYQTLDTSIMLNDTCKQVSLTLRAFENLYKAQFVVTDGTLPVEDAIIYLNNQIITTNQNGVALFENIPPGNYSFTIEKTGFSAITQELNIYENLNIPIVLNAIPVYTVSFEVTELDQPAPNVNILYNNQWMITNLDGKVTFTGIYMGSTSHYAIEKWGYYSVTDTLKEISQSITIPIAIKAIPDLILHVTHKQGDLAKARINFQNKTMYTNNNGLAIFADIDTVENEIVLIESKGYYSETQQVSISDRDQNLTSYLFKKTDLNIHITNAGEALEGVQVIMNNIEKNTDSIGHVSFLNNIEATGVSLLVNHAGYVPISTQIDFVKDVDIDTNLVLEMIPDLEFTITSKGLPIEGASIEINSMNYYSGTDGKVIITDLEKGTYAYQIEKPGYYPIKQEVVLESSDLALSVEIATIPDVTFIVSHNGTPLADAKVEMASRILETSNLGKATFTDILGGNYSYSITKDGFNSITSEIIVASEDIELALDMFLVSASMPIAHLIHVYPNPSQGKIILSLPENHPFSKIDIYDEMGMLVYTQTNPELVNPIDLGKMAKGIYFISLEGMDEIYRFKQIIY